MEHSHTCTPPPGALRNTGYTYSLSSSYSSSALRQQQGKRAAFAVTATSDPPRMSRRSLRLHTSACHYGDDSLLDSSLNHSVAYGTGSASRRESRTLKSRRQYQSLSGSQSLLHTPRKAESSAALLAHTSLHSCTASDSSLLSSMLDESCIQERTLVDSFWGLDEETDLGERSFRADRGTSASNGDMNSAQTQTSVINGYTCGDCSLHSERRHALTAFSSSSSASKNNSSANAASASRYAHADSASAVATASRSAHADSTSAAAVAAAVSTGSSTIYSLDKSRRRKTGLLASASNHVLLYGGRALSYMVSIVTLLAQSIQLPTLKEGQGMLVSLSESCLCFGRRTASSIVSISTKLAHSALHKMRQKGSDVIDVSAGALQRSCGSVNVKPLMASDGQLGLNGSLCDDCKGKQQQLETVAGQAQSSRTGRLWEALWRCVAFTGHTVQQAIRGVGSTGWRVAQSLLSVLRSAATSPGQAAGGAFWWLGTGWYQLVALLSLLNVFILTRVLPKLYKVLLLLLPLLLLLGLWFWGPAALLSYLPALNLTEWSTSPPLPWASAPLEQHTRPTAALPPTASQQAEGVAGVSVDAERLWRLEQSVAGLWEGLQGGARLQEQQHGEVLELFSSLREQLDSRTDRDGLGLWVSGLLDQRLALLRADVEQGNERGEQVQEQYSVQQQSHESRLAEMEALLQALAAKTEVLGQRAEPTAAAPISVGGDSQAHAALLGQVQRLEAELGRIRQELQGVIGCRGRCEQLDGLQDSVSAQVKQELRALFYGSAQPQKELPEPLLPWLTAQFARGSDLRATLASLEKSILGNLSLQLEQSAQPVCAESVAHTVASTTGAAGMSEEHVQLIVKNALTLYSQDRTGLVDYALESGGGSVLSTRCSETYETKTALMSLFGLPLWYFSQSPRVVIQPDVHPGNCWAFKGSFGYLVIRLSVKIRPSAFSLEHIPKSLSPTGNISSAPRHFRVYGLDDESQDEGTMLGNYTYQEDGDALQTFPAMAENEKSYQIVEVRVLSNWGHPEYTCLYRVRVHGEPERT